MPIDSIYNKAGFKKVMPKTLLDQISYKGNLYSVPVNIHRANILWYNPAVLKKAGIASAPKTWDEFVAALDKAKAAGVIPLALGEQWTQKHLLETVLIGDARRRRLGQAVDDVRNWTAPTSPRRSTASTTLLTYTNSDAASLTWQDAGKLVIDGKAAFNVMGDWQDGYFSGTLKGGNLAKKPGKRLRLDRRSGTDGVFDWLSDSFTLPKGAPHRDAPSSGSRSSAASRRRTRSTRSRARSLPGRTRTRSSTART